MRLTCIEVPFVRLHDYAFQVRAPTFGQEALAWVRLNEVGVIELKPREVCRAARCGLSCALDRLHIFRNCEPSLSSIVRSSISVLRRSLVPLSVAVALRAFRCRR